MSKTIYLVNPPNDDSVAEPAHGSSFPALGIISLGTAVKQQTGWTPRLYDGQITDTETIIQDIRTNHPEVVGLSTILNNYENTLKIAEAAKEVGAVTILGNDHASYMADKILSKRESVDYICTQDAGEQSLVDFLSYLDGEKTLAQVPGLAYREEGRTRKNPETCHLREKYPLDSLPIPDRTLLNKKNWESHAANYVRTFGDEGITGVTTMNRGRGCSKAKRPCAYCSIKDLKMRFSSPEVFWEDVRKAREDIGANLIYEVFDSMSSNPHWIRKLIDQRPEDLKNTRFFIYAQSRDLDEKTTGLLKELGVIRVNIGTDSGNDTMLKRLKGPTHSLEQNKEAMQRMKQYGIEVFTSLVVGAPGETEGSLHETEQFARWMVDNGYVKSLEVSPLVPLPGSRIWDWMSDPEVAKEEAREMGIELKNKHLFKEVEDDIYEKDLPDTTKLAECYNQIFNSITLEDLFHARDRIRTYAENRGVSTGSAFIKEK